MRGKMVNVTIAKAANGWHACFAHEIEHEAPANDLPSVGIDRGIANTLALSTGEMLSTPDLTQLERRKRRAQRVLARRVRGSNRYRKQRRRLSRITAKIARCRVDWRHRATLDIARRFGAVTLEALQVQSMTRAGKGKRGLNRSILEQGWGAFERVLSYKLEERGGTLIKVNPAYTSQTCSACGAIDKASRESQARFACRHCGFVAHADHNAAINILRRSTPRVEGSGCAPDEALTINLAA
jgi:putative transposase